MVARQENRTSDTYLRRERTEGTNYFKMKAKVIVVTVPSCVYSFIFTRHISIPLSHGVRGVDAAHLTVTRSSHWLKGRVTRGHVIPRDGLWTALGARSRVSYVQDGGK